jgi:site-specific recombinase XerD
VSKDAELHDLGHVAASLMLAAGVDIKIVQLTLGHVTSTYTRDTYTTVYPQLSRDAAEHTAALLKSASARSRTPPMR